MRERGVGDPARLDDLARAMIVERRNRENMDLAEMYDSRLKFNALVSGKVNREVISHPSQVESC
jgi:hypothetical protein